MSKIVHSVLKTLNRKGTRGLLSGICYLGYKLKGVNIKNVRYLDDLATWEFTINEDYFYSSGPGWAYSYPYLQKQFYDSLGNMYRPKPGDCVVDVGAGVGEELMVFSRLVGDRGKVFSIEAHPQTFKSLMLNNQKNGFANTVLLNVAVADTPGHIFIEGEENDLGNKVSRQSVRGATRVEAITIEQLVDMHKIDRINFMKVNIEGAEQLLIKGIGKAISKIDNMAISCHDFLYEKEGVEFFRTKAIVIEFLRDNDFTVETRNTGKPLSDDYVYAYPRGSRR
jgi:FkbM family methyltransferase